MGITNLPASDSAARESFFPYSIQLAPVVRMTQDQFFDFCQWNSDKRFERSAGGELIIMPPSGGDAGFRDLEVAAQLHAWAKAAGKVRSRAPAAAISYPTAPTAHPMSHGYRTSSWPGSLRHNARSSCLCARIS